MDLVRQADIILVPVMPSVIDMQATADFIQNLMRVGKIPLQNGKLGIISNRVREGTRAERMLSEFLSDYDIPVVTSLRDTLNYVSAMEEGKGICELCPKQTAKDRRQWTPLMDWLAQDSVIAQSIPQGVATTQAGPYYSVV